MALFDGSKKLLNALFLNHIPVYVQIVTISLHVLWCWLFIDHLKWGIWGLILATNTTYILNLVLTEVVIRRRADMKDLMVPFTYNCYAKLGSYLREALPAMFLCCFEWWVWEILAIFTGLLGVDYLAADVIFSKVTGFIFMLPLAIGFSASSMIGNSLGAGKIELAKRYADAALALSTIFITIIIYLLATFNTWTSTFFTSNAEVSAIIKDMLWLVLIHIWVDQIHGVEIGILRGLGRQGYGAFAVFICYYLMALPLALYLCFSQGLGLKGIWLGFALSTVALDGGLLFIIYRPDWSQIAEQMKESINSDEAEKPKPAVIRATEIKED